VSALPVQHHHQLFAKGIILFHKTPQEIVSVSSFQFSVGRSRSAAEN
jgi:hypothetical protein